MANALSLEAYISGHVKFGGIILARCDDLIIRQLCKVNSKLLPVSKENYSLLGKWMTLKLARNGSIEICSGASIKLNSGDIIQLSVSTLTE